MVEYVRVDICNFIYPAQNSMSLLISRLMFFFSSVEMFTFKISIIIITVITPALPLSLFCFGTAISGRDARLPGTILYVPNHFSYIFCNVVLLGLHLRRSP